MPGVRYAIQSVVSALFINLANDAKRQSLVPGNHQPEVPTREFLIGDLLASCRIAAALTSVDNLLPQSSRLRIRPRP